MPHLPKCMRFCSAAKRLWPLLVISAFLLLYLDTSHPSLESIDVHLEPTYATLHGAEVLWQIPKKPRGAVFFAHGCNHKATHFWDQHPNCQTCIGLPEDTALVKAALGRGYAVLTVSSVHTCWNLSWPTDQSEEVLTVSRAIATWRKQNHLQGLPIYALGASSGGYFLCILAHKVHFSALVVMISSGFKPALSEPLAAGEKFPPTLFVHMVKDRKMRLQVMDAIDSLHSVGVSAVELPCYEFPITPWFLSERIAGLTEAVSRRIHDVLVKEHLLDRRGFLLKDGRATRWALPVEHQKILPLESGGRLKWQDHIEEELNLAYALHEMTSLNSSQVFNWFDSACRQGGLRQSHRCDVY
eukprot:jgi/Mesen1/4668/ME000241S03709